MDVRGCGKVDKDRDAWKFILKEADGPARAVEPKERFKPCLISHRH
jgi:uncharacterized membrane protein